MVAGIEVFNVLGALARHAAEAQRVSAINVSRAGEPGYKSQQVEPFADFLARVEQGGENKDYSRPFRIVTSDAPAGPNGNSVSIEQELYSSAAATGQHNMAITAYSKTLDLMRMAMSSRR